MNIFQPSTEIEELYLFIKIIKYKENKPYLNYVDNMEGGEKTVFLDFH